MKKRNTGKRIPASTVLLMLYDALAVFAAYFLALLVRFDFQFSRIPPIYFDEWLRFSPVYVIVCLIVFYVFHLYKSLWEYVSYDELKNLLIVAVITAVFHVAGSRLLFGRMPSSYYLMGAVFQFIAVTGIRFAYRFALVLRDNTSVRANSTRLTRCMLIGAGDAGRFILREINYARDAEDRILCIIDDNENKQGRFVEGVKVVGGRDDILFYVHKYNIEKILIAIPSATDEEKRDIYNICKETGCVLKYLPEKYQFSDGDIIFSSKMKDVSVEDLLDRTQVRVEMEQIYRSLQGKTILVTGGGGSIGGELCRQIAGHHPGKLIIFDIYENSIYDIEQELRHEFRDLDFAVEIGSVRDSRRVDQIFSQYKPDIVYHAAAHKHVPLMEGSPCEAIKNNVFGTYKTAYAAMTHGCQRFVLVSTDKAVNPTNIMGASKRICEMIVQAFDKKIKENRANEILEMVTHEETADQPKKQNGIPKPVTTEFVAVRFGNVLGSNGSVIPLFKKMIERGGPVEVTHKDIIRYFMTIPEAVSLILQAGTYAKGGEIFVLDMGEPVKIDTLARNLIKLSGYTPDKDIQIVYTGLRPGEKLYEEKLMAEEGLTKTPNNLIHVGRPVDFDVDAFLQALPRLMTAAYENQDDIKAVTKEIVSTYAWSGDE